MPHGDRGGVPVEPLLTTQWYCNAAVLAKPAIAAVETGKISSCPRVGKNLLRVDVRHPRLVHLAAALVGASDPGLVLDRRAGLVAKDGKPVRFV